MLSKVSRFRYWLVGLVLAVVVAVGVVVAVDAFADIGAGGSDRPCVGECNEEAWPIWRFGSWASTDEFISSEKNDTNWDWPSEATSAAKEAYAKALAQCKATDAGGKCNDPVIVAAGYMTILKDGSPSSVASNVINESGADALKSTWSQAYGAQGFDTCHTWLLNSERRVNSCSKMGESASVNTRASQDANYSDSTLVVMVVLSGDDVNTSMTGEDCARIVTGGIDNLRWGPDGIWVAGDIGRGPDGKWREPLVEDSEKNSLRDIRGAVSPNGYGTDVLPYVWDSEHVWRAGTEKEESYDVSHPKLTLIKGYSGHIQAVRAASTDNLNKAGNNAIISTDTGAWLIPDSCATGGDCTLVALNGAKDAFMAMDQVDGTKGFVGVAYGDNGAWLFGADGTMNQIPHVTGKIVGGYWHTPGQAASGDRAPSLHSGYVYGDDGLWAFSIVSDDYHALGDVSSLKISSKQVTADKVSIAGTSNRGLSFGCDAGGLCYYSYAWYQTADNGFHVFRYDPDQVVVEDVPVLGDSINAPITGFSVDGNVDDGSSIVYSSSTAWILDPFYTSYRPSGAKTVVQKQFMYLKKVDGITGKILDSRDPDFVASSDGAWKVNRADWENIDVTSLLPAHGSGLTFVDGNPEEGQYTSDKVQVNISAAKVQSPASVKTITDVVNHDFLATGLSTHYLFGMSASPQLIEYTEKLRCVAINYKVQQNDYNGDDVTNQTDAPSTQYIMPGQSVTLPALNKLPDGWLFDKVWHDCPDGVDKNVGDVCGDISGDTTFIVFLKQAVSLSFNLSEAEGQSDASKTPATQTLTKGSYGTKPSPNPTWTGREFDSWRLKDSSRFDFNTTAINEDTTVYAKWTLTQYFGTTVDDCADWTNWTPISGISYGSNAQSITDPTCSGYTFTGWAVGSADSTDVVTDLTTVKLTKNTTFYAKWSRASGQVKFLFHKVDSADTSKGLPGAEFTVTGGSLPSDGKKFTSDSNGLVSVEVPSGAAEYTLVESKAPTGYSLGQQTSFTVNVADNSTVSFGSINQCYDGSTFGCVQNVDDLSAGTMQVLNLKLPHVRFRKVDATDTSKGLRGAEFTVIKDNSEVAKATSDEDGYVDVDLPNSNGMYKFTETVVPDGYDSSQATTTYFYAYLSGSSLSYQYGYCFDNSTSCLQNTGNLSDGSMLVLNSKPLTIRFRKVDSADTSKGLSGAEFHVMGRDYDETVISDSEGYVEFDLPLKSDSYYFVSETKAPSGYENSLSGLTLSNTGAYFSHFCLDGDGACVQNTAGFSDGTALVLDKKTGGTNPVDHFPQTGRTGSMVFPVVGGLLIILAAFIAWALHRRGHGGVDGSGDSSVPTAPSDSSSASTVSSSVDGLTVGGDPSVVGEVEVPVSHPVDSDL